jgi:hypothetical protein
MQPDSLYTEKHNASFRGRHIYVNTAPAGAEQRLGMCGFAATGAAEAQKSRRNKTKEPRLVGLWRQ